MIVANAFVVGMLSLLIACGPRDQRDLRNLQSMPLGEDASSEGAARLSAVSNFYSQPLLCDEKHSVNYYCDGYVQQNLPLGPDEAPPTPENMSSYPPVSGFVGLQVLGTFDAKRPSVVFIHGWNVEGSSQVLAFPDQWAQQIKLAGFNVLQFHWAAPAYDSGQGCPGFGWFGFSNIPCNASHALYKSGGVADQFLAAYKARFTGSTQKVRIVAQSLGAPLATYVSYRMHYRNDFGSVARVSRLDLIDPFLMPGMGGDRTKPYDGQLPPDVTLPADYRSVLVSSFVPGSSCHSHWNPLPPNHLSQYCQNEGMIYRLVKDKRVGVFVLSSIVGGASAQDLRKVALFQAFSSSAFQGNILSRHVTPNAAYFYSFAPGTPSNGYDASTSDSTILSAARAQAVDLIDQSRIQTSGFDTISLLDDGYSKR